MPAKARCTAAWADPDRTDDAPEPPAFGTKEWLTHRGSPTGRAYISPETLQNATHEFFVEYKDLSSNLSTSLLRHREQFWREAEENKLSQYLTTAFCVFCAFADYAIMIA